MKCFASIAFAVFPAMVLAQDISIKMDQIPAGSWFLMDSGGKATTHVFRGKQGRYYVYDVVPGKDPNGERHSRDFRDASGNNIKREFGISVVKYTPHNCQRVIGQCSFVESGKKADGTPYKTDMVRVNTLKGKGFTYYQVAIAEDGTQIPVRSGQVQELDQMGMLVRGKSKRHTDGRTTNHKKRAASWD